MWVSEDQGELPRRGDVQAEIREETRKKAFWQEEQCVTLLRQEGTGHIKGPERIKELEGNEGGLQNDTEGWTP